MIATSGFLAALECTSFVFGRGSTPGLTGGAYSAPRPPSWCTGVSTSKGKEKGESENGRGEEGKGKRGNGRHRPPFANSWIRPWHRPNIFAVNSTYRGPISHVVAYTWGVGQKLRDFDTTFIAHRLILHIADTHHPNEKLQPVSNLSFISKFLEKVAEIDYRNFWTVTT